MYHDFFYNDLLHLKILYYKFFTNEEIKNEKYHQWCETSFLFMYDNLLDWEFIYDKAYYGKLLIFVGKSAYKAEVHIKLLKNFIIEYMKFQYAMNITEEPANDKAKKDIEFIKKHMDEMFK